MWLLILLTFFVIPPKIIAAVPAPSLPTNKIPYVGTFYMPGFKIGSPLTGWRGIENTDSSRKPLLGYFDEGNPEAMDWEIKWALESGINFFIFDWYRCSDGTDIKCSGDNSVLGKPITSDNLLFSSSLHQGFFNSQFQNQMKFAIMLTGQVFSTDDDLRDNLLDFIIDEYLIKPNYLKIDNRPLLFFYGVGNTDNKDDSPELGKFDPKAIRIIRETIIKAGFGDPYLIAEDRFFTVRNKKYANSFKQIGYDHTFSYWPQVYRVGNKYFDESYASITEDDALEGMKQSFSWIVNNQTLPFIANANPMANGVNTRRWTLSPSKYENLMTYLKSDIIPNIKSDLGKKVIITDAWNEITEGHWIAPTHKYNFDYLKSIRKILTNGDNTPDYRLPLDNNFGPYDHEYQNLIQHAVPPSVFEKTVYEFPKDGDYLIADKSPTGNSDKLSFGAWFSSSKPQKYVPLKKGYSLQLVIESNGRGHCAISTDNTPWYPTSGGTTAGWTSNNFTFNDEWHHLFCVYDGTRLRAFVDGKITGTSTTAVTGLTVDPYRDVIFGKNYQGKIAKLKIVKEAYTASQVAALYESTKIISTPTPTKIPTTTPTIIKSLCTQCPSLPQAKSKGDADCSGTININDVSVWRSEFISGGLGSVNKNSWQSDFNCDGKTNLIDASIWRDNFNKGL